jgi:hypothetical protein
VISVSVSDWYYRDFSEARVQLPFYYITLYQLNGWSRTAGAEDFVCLSILRLQDGRYRAAFITEAVKWVFEAVQWVFEAVHWV